MHDCFEREICDHCGDECERGYWHHDATLCASCLLLAQELVGPGADSPELATRFTDADDAWDYTELVTEDISVATTLSSRY